MNALSFRKRVWQAIEPAAYPRPGLSLTNRLLVSAILLGVIVSILATEPALGTPALALVAGVEVILTAIFIGEYAARFWVAAENEGQGSNGAKRFRFMLSPSSLIDLATILVSLAPFLGINAMALRLVRLLRIMRLAKLGRMSMAIRHLSDAVFTRRYELIATMGLALGLLILGATALYWIEGELQPDKFGSIPRALWWAVVTLTTIGYGDVFPITPLGKAVAGFVAIVGIGVIALPTGILAAAFSDAVQRGGKSWDGDNRGG